MFRQITSATLVHALLLLSLVASTPSRGQACNIPVFRYALERWNPDTARVMVFYEGSLGDGDEALVSRMEQDTKALGGTTNAEMVRIDVTGAMGEKERAIWKQYSEGSKRKATLCCRSIFVEQQSFSYCMAWNVEGLYSSGFTRFTRPKGIGKTIPRRSLSRLVVGQIRRRRKESNRKKNSGGRTQCPRKEDKATGGNWFTRFGVVFRSAAVGEVLCVGVGSKRS
jgi:hypothetical protein